MFAKGLGLLVSLIGAFWLAIAGAWGTWRYERLPVGWPNVPVKCCLVVRFTVHLPGAGSVTVLAADLASLKAQEAAAARRAAAVTKAQAAITSAASAHAVAVQTRIRTVTRTLIQQVPYAVPPAADPFLSRGWLRLHDAAVGSAGLPDASSAAAAVDGTPSDVRSSEALARVIGNYGAANSCRAELIGLQDWLVRVEAAAAAQPAGAASP